MRSFKTFLTERYVNTFTPTDKEKYIDQVWEIIQRSYAKIGGLKTNGLTTPEGLIHNTKMWKLVRDGDKIKVAMLYKDKEGRKSVAVATDGSNEAKQALIRILKADLENSYREVSDSLEFFIFKHMPELANKFKIPVETVQNLVKDEIRPKEDGYHYDRKIGNEWHTKIMMGSPGKKFY